MINKHALFRSGQYYHIYNRGNNKENLFNKDQHYIYFLDRWTRYIKPYANTLAYCLMPNHFHFLIMVNPSRAIEPSEDTSSINALLEDQFKSLFSGYTLAINRSTGRIGSLFSKRFKRIEINSDDYLTRIIHYIHHNPIHHKYTQSYSSWLYSSFQAILSNKPTNVDRDSVLQWFGGYQAFVAFHKQNLNYHEIEEYIIE